MNTLPSCIRHAATVVQAAACPCCPRALVLLLTMGLSGGLFSAGAIAQEHSLEPVVVEAEALVDGPERSEPRTLYQVGQETIRLFDTAGGTNPLTALAHLPGIKVATVDAYGLNNTRGGQKGIRVRGEVSTHGMMGTVDGVALVGPGPGPGYLALFDKENIAAVSVAQGAVSADGGGLFTTSGVVDTRLLYPRDHAEREISFGVGSDGFQRYFARIDTGTFGTGTALFVSASKTMADKWRGYGDAPKGRDNVEVGFKQNLGKLNMKLIYAHNEQDQHDYKALTYDDARHNRKRDFGRNNASSDYYGFNQHEFRSEALLTDFSYDFNDHTRFSFKPFWMKEKGNYLFAAPNNNMVTKLLADHDSYGANAEFSTVVADTRIRLGYAWTSTEPPGPQINQKSYRIVNGKLVFQQWAVLSDVTDRHEFWNYYLTGLHRFDKLTVQGGIRYARERLPGIDSYMAGAATAGSSWDVSPHNAANRADKDDRFSVKARSFGKWLPEIGVSYEFTPTASVYASLGRNIGMPALNVFRTAPAGNILSGQEYWDAIRPELSNNLDLGAHLRFGDFALDPTLYFSRSKNKSVSVYNDASQSLWSQNVGETAARGVLLASAWEPSETLHVFGNLSYTRSYFTKDIRGTGGFELGVKGNQLPDVPKYMGNIGMVLKTAGVTIAPVVQYVGSRWGTVNYKEKIPAYFTFDVSAGYGQKASWGSWEASLALFNVFDRHYIGQVSTSETTISSGAIYYPGAPRTLAAKLSFNF